MIPREVLITTAVLFAVALGMGIYVAELRNREEVVPPPSPALTPVAASKSGPTKAVTVWVAHDDSGSLQPESVVVPVASDPQQQATELLRGLLKVYLAKDSPHPIGAGAELHDVFLVPPGLAVIDLNAAFADQQASGILSEELTIASFVETLSHAVPELRQVKFLIDGKERETLAGHADIAGIYDVARIDELARQLSQH
jgi:spore germination protein GerM